MTSWRWWLGWPSVPLAIAAAILAWSGWNLLANARLRRDLERLEAAGEPVRIAQLPRMEIPAGPNASPLYEEATLLLIPGEGAGAERPWVWDRPLDSGERDRAKLWVSRNRHTLDLLVRASETPLCRSPFQAAVFQTLDSRRFHLNSCILLLGTAARLANESGESETADRCLAAAVATCRFGDGAPGLGALQRRAWNLNSAASACRAAFESGFAPGRSLREAIGALPAGLFTDSIPAALRAERARGIELVLGPSSQSRLSRYTHAPLPRSLVFRLLRPAQSGKLSGFLEGHARLLEASSGQPAGLFRVAWEIRHDASPGWWLPGESAYYSASDVVSLIAADMELDLLKAALAGLPGRAADGTWPDTWPELEALRDRSTGGPYVKRREGKILVVESPTPGSFSDRKLVRWEFGN